MTTTLDPLTALQQRQCRSGRCTRIAHPYAKGLCEAHAYQHGIIRPYIDAQTVAAHIRHLDVPAKAIARAARVTPQTIHNILNGSSRRVKATVSDRILAVTPDNIPAVGYRPTWPATRRVQALRAAGWRLDELEEHTGVDKGSLGGISFGRYDSIQADTDQAIRNTYRELGPAIKRKAVWSVERRGWPLPAEWNNPDDPDEDPTILRTAYADDLRPAISHIIAHHGSLTSAAQQLGVHKTYLYRLARSDRHPSGTTRQKITDHYLHLHGAAA